MLLPEGIHRENTKMYEEVEIPPNEPMPIGFEERPVYITELDEVRAVLCSYCTNTSEIMTHKAFTCDIVVSLSSAKYHRYINA